jgi:hypothetical protein
MSRKLKNYQVTIKNKFAALENVDDNVDINKAWETIRENIRISAKESIGLCESKYSILYYSYFYPSLIMFYFQ